MKIIYTIILCLFVFKGFAQDPSFSQFYANRIYLNPAFAGLERGVSVAGVSRMQWVNVDQGFRTYGASLEIQEPFINSGIGIGLFHNTQGLAQLNSTSVDLTYAYMIPLENHSIHIGLQAHWVQKYINWDELIFSDELDPVNGAVLGSSYVPVLERTSFTDFSAGVLWRFNTDMKIGKKKYRDVRHSIGISAHHLPALFGTNAGGESLQNLETRTTARVTMHAGSMIPLTFFNSTKKEILLSPNLKVDVQGEGLFKFTENLQVFTYGAYFIYESFYVGAMYQNKNIFSHHKNTNAWILAVGTYIDTAKDQSLFIGFSYDANTTGVGTAAGGVYEISFRWTGNPKMSILGDGSRKRAKRALDCYRFF